VKRLDHQLAPLEPRPCAALAGRHDRPIDRVGLDPVVALVAGDRVQRRLLDHAADVEDNRPDTVSSDDSLLSDG
jgi:hypothetical protein